MVRARIQGHLEALKKRFPDFLGECEIHEFAGTDYAYRLFGIFRDKCECRGKRPSPSKKAHKSRDARTKKRKSRYSCRNMHGLRCLRD